MVDDNVFREVDEELRRERLAKLWELYGVYVVGVAVGVVLLMLGGIWWQNKQISDRQAAGDKFIEALRDVSKGEDKKAEDAFKGLINDSPAGYELLARLHLAASKASSGETGEAEILYKKVALDPSADKILRDYAKLNLAILRLDAATYDETLAALGEFIKPGAMWRGTANEVIALAAYKEGKLDIAKKRYSEIIVEAGAPSALKRRAQVMLDVIATSEVTQ